MFSVPDPGAGLARGEEGAVHPHHLKGRSLAHRVRGAAVTEAGQRGSKGGKVNIGAGNLSYDMSNNNFCEARSHEYSTECKSVIYCVSFKIQIDTLKIIELGHGHTADDCPDFLSNVNQPFVLN